MFCCQVARVRQIYTSYIPSSTEKEEIIVERVNHDADTVENFLESYKRKKKRGILEVEFKVSIRKVKAKAIMRLVYD